MCVGSTVPQVIRSCTEFIERYGVVDGIYRLSGISSNIQKLRWDVKTSVIIMYFVNNLKSIYISSFVCRHEFDSEQLPDLTKDTYVQDIHSVGSLCKLYFRELPNPLLTYQLYEKFSVSKHWRTSDSTVLILEVMFWHICHRMLYQLPLMRRGWSKSMMSYSSCLRHTTGLNGAWHPLVMRKRTAVSFL